jgi:hypothetical protein
MWSVEFWPPIASPLVCGVLAAALSVDRAYLRLPRDASRAEYALEKLEQLCQSLGFSARYQGAGLPVLPAAAAAPPI